jgi:hypothetical protein
MRQADLEQTEAGLVPPSDQAYERFAPSQPTRYPDALLPGASASGH